jgi:hypothetical protein
MTRRKRVKSKRERTVSKVQFLYLLAFGDMGGAFL